MELNLDSVMNFYVNIKGREMSEVERPMFGALCRFLERVFDEGTVEVNKKELVNTVGFTFPNSENT